MREKKMQVYFLSKVCNKCKEFNQEYEQTNVFLAIRKIKNMHNDDFYHAPL
jgi:phage FluMu protein Com